MAVTIFYTPAEIAEILKVSYDSALWWVKYSGVRYIRVGKQYRVPRQAFEKALEDGMFAQGRAA